MTESDVFLLIGLDGLRPAGLLELHTGHVMYHTVIYLKATAVILAFRILKIHINESIFNYLFSSVLIIIIIYYSTNNFMKYSISNSLLLKSAAYTKQLA